ncbi:MAG: SMC-Scp complex subunit ScpB [Acidobacteria bacterium]|nr:SMC-Scp complex subunit ScpB [Acidobacteriota bacterium]
MLSKETYDQIIAILFVAREPVTLRQFQEVFPALPELELVQNLSECMSEFNSLQGAVQLRQIAGGYRITTRPEHHELIREYLKTRASAKLSLAALETLAVIAYRQPITLPEIMDIRSVRGTSTIRTLLEKKLIETRGRKKEVGRPILYGTTQEFLVHFGLNDLSELPTLEEFAEIFETGDTLHLSAPESPPVSSHTTPDGDGSLPANVPSPE